MVIYKAEKRLDTQRKEKSKESVQDLYDECYDIVLL